MTVHVQGRVQYIAGPWGGSVPVANADIQILDLDPSNSPDVLWSGRTGTDGRFTCDSDVPWRDKIRVTNRWWNPWPPPGHWEESTSEVDDPTDVLLLSARVKEPGRPEQTFAVLVRPDGELIQPLVLPWPPRIRIPINGMVRYAPVAGGGLVEPAPFVEVEITENDPTDGSVDPVYEGMTNLEGRFTGQTRTIDAWLEDGGDVPMLVVTLRQGPHQISFPAVLVADTIQLPPLVLPWGPGWSCTPCGQSPAALALRQAEISSRKALYRWAYDVDGRIGNCADPLPPNEVAWSARFDREYGAKSALGKANEQNIRNVEWPRDPFDDADDYRKFFPPFDAPAVLARYPKAQDLVIPDQEFADQRLKGPNPMMLRRIDKESDLPDRFGGGFVALRQRCAAVADLGDLLARRRLYLADYEILEEVPAPQNGRYLPKPFALFGVIQGRLAPVAIQIERVSGPTNPVFTPRDADVRRWNVAKLMVQIADMTVHEMQIHLFQTHLVMEPFAVAMARSMSSMHPIFRLLQPHFMGMLAKNSQARNYLMSPAIGPVKDILASIDIAKAVVRNAVARWSFPRAALPRLLADRGLDDTSALPEYPYRDDGLVIWRAIEDFVTEFVRETYGSDSEISGCDTELQAWLSEVRSPIGGRLRTVPEVRTAAELIAVLTQVIFTCSAQHSAVNFSQYDYMGFVPNMPGAAYARPLPGPQGPGETDLRKLLPGADPAMRQTELMWSLASYRYDRLGDTGVVLHEPWAGVVRRFRDRLRLLELQLEGTDGGRRIKYPYLRPSLIINSINV